MLFECKNFTNHTVKSQIAINIMNKRVKCRGKFVVINETNMTLGKRLPRVENFERSNVELAPMMDTTWR